MISILSIIYLKLKLTMLFEVILQRTAEWNFNGALKDKLKHALSDFDI